MKCDHCHGKINYLDLYVRDGEGKYFHVDCTEDRTLPIDVFIEDVD